MEKEFAAFRFPKTSLIGQILLKMGLINSEQLEEALKIQKKEGGLLGDILIKQGFITEESLYMAIAEQCDLIYIPVEKYNVAKDLLKLVPREIYLQYFFIPLERIGDVLTVAVANPFNEEEIEAIQKSTPYKMVCMVGSKTQIEKIIKTNY